MNDIFIGLLIGILTSKLLDLVFQSMNIFKRVSKHRD